MSKFSTSEKLNRSIARAQKRRELMNIVINEKIKSVEAEYLQKYGDTSGVYPYMTGYLQSMIGTLAQCETIAEMRRAVNYSFGVKL